MTAAPAVAAAQPVSFATPAFLQGDTVVEAQWAVIEIGPQGTGQATLEGGRGIAQYANSTWMTSNLLASWERRVDDSTSQQEVAFDRATATFQNGGLFGIASASLLLNYTGNAVIHTLGPGSDWGVHDGIRSADDDDFSPWAAPTTRAQVVMEIADAQLLLSAKDVERLEFLNARIACSTSDGCPTGGDSSAVTLMGVAVETRSFERITGTLGDAAFEGVAARVLIGGTIPTLTLLGAARLPMADSPCNCGLDADGTLTLSGPMQFARMQAADGRIMTSLDAREGTTAFLDEALLGGFVEKASVGVVAAVGAGAILVKLFGILFTRLSKEQALEHPRRRQIYEYIQEHPGANFREVARETAIATGTVRHHLTVLERSGHVVEHAHQGTIRFFENHGKFDRNWNEVVLLREEPMAEIHSWVKEHPGCTQKAILEGLEARGRSRSTTQHRLQRLVRGGAIVVRLQGRLQIHHVAGHPEAKPIVRLVPPEGPAVPRWSTNPNVVHS